MTDSLRDRLQSTLGSAYTLERELGGGGMSRVFVAHDQSLRRDVVVKVLAPALAQRLSVERFAREIRLAASLQEPHIVPVLSAGAGPDGLPYYTMPFVRGESLRARLANGPLPVAECAAILRDIARALAYAHREHVVHRDIKPENILLHEGTAVVTDFGIAKALSASREQAPHAHDDDANTLTQMGTSLGTPAYMAPEQVVGDPSLDHRADIYALGVVAFEMLAGHVPFAGAPQQVMAAHVTLAPPALPARADLPRGLERVVMRCLAKAPADRYQFADELLVELDRVLAPGTSPAERRRRFRRLAFAAGAVAAVVSLAWFGSARWRNHRWARRDALPRIQRYVDVAQNDSAWMLARRVQAVLPKDSALAALWPRFSTRTVLNSVPEGARVWRASFADSSEWVFLGTTPTDSIYLPNAFGRVRVERPGYRRQLGLIAGQGRTFYLDAESAPDSDMVHVPGGTFNAFLVGLDWSTPLALGDYMIDRREVSNRDFKAFVDAGGYRRRELWPATFELDGRSISWERASALFVDRTGRPGPSTWEAGEFPNGRADYPVSGVSWYEAAAYARFRGKSLPTVYHWARAAAIGAARYTAPGSIFESAGPAPVGASRGMSVYGAADMAGNVREWCENATGGAGGEQRYILGGGWTDPPYAFTDAYAQPPMDRSAINGIRLARYLGEDSALALARAPQPRASRDYARERPVSDATFASYLPLYDYDRGALDTRVELRDATMSEDWTLERVSFAAAYGGERMIANVYVPKQGRPPYQPIVFFPGSNVITQGSSLDPRAVQLLGFLAKSGRMLVLPILKSTFERRDSLKTDLSDSSVYWRDHVVMWDKDVRRTVDYLATRSDVDTARIGFFGVSWGANQAPIVLATEPRFRAAVLYVAGLAMEGSRPEVDPFNFLPRVKQPLRMLNGRYDFFFPVERAQQPFFKLLGTPADRKKYTVYEGGHDVPRTALIAETLAWFDRYLGPMR